MHELFEFYCLDLNKKIKKIQEFDLNKKQPCVDVFIYNRSYIHAGPGSEAFLSIPYLGVEDLSWGAWQSTLANESEQSAKVSK